MRRGAGKSKTDNEKESVPEGEETATQGNGDTVVSASGGESDKEDKSTAATTTAKKRKGKRGKKEESSANAGDEAQNAEPGEKKAKRATRNIKTYAEGTTEDQGEEYEVEKIVDMKESRGKRLFKIQWKGYGPESDTWEEEQDLSCPELIKDFMSQFPNKGKKRNAKSPDSKTKKPRVSFSDGKPKEADQKEYEVAQVMEMSRKKSGKREFLVHWKGFSHDEDTWEPEENLNCAELIEEFMKKNKTSNAKADRKGAARASGKGKKAGRRNNKQKAAQNSE